MALSIHPVAEIFPEMSAAQIAQLTDDIRENGLREAVLLHPDGSIIDGRNRYKACLSAEVMPSFRTWDGKGSLIATVLSLNLHRRHLDESQRAMVGARSKPMFEAEAKQRQSTSTGGVSPKLKAEKQEAPQLVANLPQAEKGKSRDEAAKMVNVSPRSVEMASKVIKRGSPELVKAVDRGDVSVSAAAEVAELPHEQQRATLTEGQKQIVARANEVRESKKQKRTTGRPETISPFDLLSARMIEILGSYERASGKTVESIMVIRENGAIVSVGVVSH